jgi:energy-coupling factor transporter ATP-binding protein EcfA2
LLSWKLTGHTGFLLHAATVIRKGKAYVFTGRSGAGKSTVASLSPRGSVLTDEISLLRCQSGVWRAYGTPFWGEFRAAGSNTSAPVRGIFRLVQAAENRVTALRPVELLRALLPNVLFFSPEAEANRRLLKILGQAVETISGYDLAFRKDRAFWEVLPE